MMMQTPILESLGFSSFETYFVTLLSIVVINHVVVWGIARWRGQPGVARMAVRDMVIGTLWLLSLIGSWIAIYFFLRAFYRAFAYEDVAAGAF